MPDTREVYRVGENGSRSYSGYATFDNNGNFTGTRGGYGPSSRGQNPNRTGNARTNGASMVQNYIQTAGIRGRNRGRR